MDLKSHDITTSWGTNKTSSDIVVVFIQSTNVSWVGVVVKHFFMVRTNATGKTRDGRTAKAPTLAPPTNVLVTVPLAKAVVVNLKVLDNIVEEKEINFKREKIEGIYIKQLATVHDVITEQ